MLISVGASEALFATFSALSVPGDEWILIEPFYAKYEPQIKIVGAIPRFTALKPVRKKINFVASNTTKKRNSHWIERSKNQVVVRAQILGH